MRSLASLCKMRKKYAPYRFRHGAGLTTMHLDGEIATLFWTATLMDLGTEMSQHVRACDSKRGCGLWA